MISYPYRKIFSLFEPNGESVVITFIESNQNTLHTDDSSWNNEDWDQFNQLIEDCPVDTGIKDSFTSVG